MSRTWFLELSGDDHDLKTLVEAFRDGDIRVSKEEDKYFVSSPRFEGLSDARATRDVALLVVAILNGTLSVALNGTEPISLGNGFRREADGRRSFTLFADAAVWRLRGTPEGLTKLLFGGNTQLENQVPIKEWTLLGLSDAAVTKVLRINATPPLDWFDLYRVVEIITNDVGGIEEIEARGWMPMGAARLLKWTANSAEVLGLDARHGVQHHESPRNPMPIAHARTLVRRLTWPWLQSKRG